MGDCVTGLICDKLDRLLDVWLVGLMGDWVDGSLDGILLGEWVVGWPGNCLDG